jgi:hypothetical protein
VVRPLLVDIGVKPFARMVGVAVWVALGVMAGCGGVTLQPSDGGSAGGHSGEGGSSSGGQSGSAGTGGAGGTQCTNLDEYTCKTRTDCTAQYCGVCPNSTFNGCAPLGAPPVDCPGPGPVEACVLSCDLLDEALCKARNDCQADYCPSCGGPQTFVGCGEPGGGTACPAIACVRACGTIMASDYDQSCATDADCVAEPEGDFCGVNTCTNCRNAVVSVKAQMQYESDLASKISTPSICPCPSGPTAVCNNGRCAIE